MNMKAEATPQETSSLPIQISDDHTHQWVPIYEDSILMGQLYFGDECTLCRKTKNTGPGPLDLGIYK